MPSPVPHHRWSVDAPLLHPERRLFLHLLLQDYDGLFLFGIIVFSAAMAVPSARTVSTFLPGIPQMRPSAKIDKFWLDFQKLAKRIKKMNLLAASCEVSKTARNEASFGEFTLRD